MEPVKVRDWFLWLVAFVYLWAFASLYYQIPGLYGDHGILPVSSVLHCVADDLFECAFSGPKPTGLHLFVEWIGLSPQHAMEFAAVLGMAIASLCIVFTSFQCFTMFITLWYLYFSCFQAGQTFLWFQWDTLLVEAGFLTAMVAPFRLLRSEWLPHDNVTLFLVRWLAFRLMFASGVVKLTSECPTWWGLTALHYHFESQCIPTSMAYFAHQLPDWMKKLGVASTYLVEIFIPPLFL
uniref:Lipase maturation factor n=1 Tax=Plectus sambesii TaxID=2011161 RepID=A0A914W072_9BILA